MKLYDYMYFRITYYYRNRWKDMNNDTGILLIFLFQGLNVLSAILLLAIIFENINNLFPQEIEGHYYSPFLILGLAVIYVYNLYRYKMKVKYELLESLWKHEVKKQKRKKMLIIIFYCIGSIMIFACTAIYRAYYL